MPDKRRQRGPTWIENWRRRHRHPVSLLLHIVGIPLTLVCIPLIAYQCFEGQWGLWWRPLSLAIAGYFLQWLGHRIEGNELGEVVLVKKWLGRPYVDISPKYAGDDDMDAEADAV